MNRVDKFKRARSIRKRYMLSVALFFLVMVTGVIITDYSLNSLLKDEKGLNIIQVKSVDNILEVWFMNNRFYINTKYIARDYRNFKNYISDFFHFQ